MRYQLIKPINQNYSVIQQILTNRNIPIDKINNYLFTSDADVAPPEALGQNKLRQAAAALISTISKQGRTLVVVDSDCDGFTSSAILINYLHDFFPSWVQTKLNYIFHEGKQHGLNDHILNIQKQNYELVIIPDAGSNDSNECTCLFKQGTKTIVLDHHLCDIQNPNAIVINNQLSDYPNKDFSGAGVVWQFCRYLDKLLKVSNADNYLDLVALGNCADMMSMTSIETKHIINKGFQNLKNPFFASLAKKNEYSMKNKVNHMSVAFYVAPYVNAICRSGTIEQKTLVFKSMLKHQAFKEVLSTKRGHLLGQKEQLVEQAMRVVTNVKNRQTKAQDNGLAIIEKMIEEQGLLKHKVLLFLLEPGQVDKNIAGLIANKIMAKYQRPTCILTKEEIPKYIIDLDLPPWEKQPLPQIVTIYQGSARGCEKVGVLDFKSICADTGVTMYQTGHPNAFGLGILEQNIPAFIQKTDAALVDMQDEAVYYVDYIYDGDNIQPIDILTIADMQDLWGKDIDEPYLCIKGICINSDMVTVYKKKDNTLKITLSNGISLMKFKATDEQCEMLQNSDGYYTLDVIGRANKNEWMGHVSAQIFIEDYEIIDYEEGWF